MLSFTVALDLESRVALGQKIEDTLHSKAEVDAEDVALSVRVGWRTTGGRKSAKEFATKLLDHSDWRAGSERSFSFEFDPPPVPLSYTGSLEPESWPDRSVQSYGQGATVPCIPYTTVPSST